MNKEKDELLVAVCISLLICIRPHLDGGTEGIRRRNPEGAQIPTLI